MEAYNREVEQRKTRSMLFRFFLLAIFLPLTAGALVFAYQYLAAENWERKEWKLVVFCLWIGTMLSLLWDAFTLLRSEKAHATGGLRYIPKESSRDPQKEQVVSSSIQRWESARSRRILKELSLTAVILPLSATALIFLYDQTFAAKFERSDWKNVFFVVWICSLLALLRVARKAKNDGGLHQALPPSKARN